MMMDRQNTHAHKVSSQRSLQFIMCARLGDGHLRGPRRAPLPSVLGGHGASDEQRAEMRGAAGVVFSLS